MLLPDTAFFFLKAAFSCAIFSMSDVPFVPFATPFDVPLEIPFALAFVSASSIRIRLFKSGSSARFRLIGSMLLLAGRVLRRLTPSRSLSSSSLDSSLLAHCGVSVPLRLRVSTRDTETDLRAGSRAAACGIDSMAALMRCDCVCRCLAVCVVTVRGSLWGRVLSSRGRFSF